jgi:hypothetical protein
MDTIPPLQKYSENDLSRDLEVLQEACPGSVVGISGLSSSVVRHDKFKIFLPSNKAPVPLLLTSTADPYKF